MFRWQNFRLVFNFFVAWTLISLAFATISYLAAIGEGRAISFQSAIISSFSRFFLWGALFPLIYKLTRKFNFDSKGKYLRNLVIHIFLGLIFSTFHFIANTLLAWLLSPTFSQYFPSLLHFLQSSVWGSLYLGLIIYALIVFAIQAYLSHLNYTVQQKRAALLQSELVQSQLQALKMQLQPHFLFNTLNSISSLVLTNPHQAHAMIAQLGDFLRLTLDYNEDQMVLLKEELRFLRSYLEIEQTRFSDRLQVNFDIKFEVLNAVVPHLVLQPLVENSIKHGISQLKAGGNIEIKADEFENKLRLQVKNDCPENKTAGTNLNELTKRGTGLSNIESRLNHIYGKDFNLEMKNGYGTTVTIILPLNFDFAANKTE